MPYENSVLHRERLVEPKRVPELRGLLGRSVVLQHHLYRVAGDQVDHQKYEDRDAQQHRDKLQEPLDDVPVHAAATFGCTCRW